MIVNLIPCLADIYSYRIIDPENKNVSLIGPAEFGAVYNLLKNKNLTPNYMRNATQGCKRWNWIRIGYPNLRA